MIAGGTVATDSAVFEADVVIEDGRIAALAEPGAAPAADEQIDASGLVVMPGAIDMHAHFEDPGHTEREDFTTGTMAAAAGGITTVFEHPLTYPPVTTTALYREKREMAERKVVVDFGLWGALTPTSIPEIAGQWAEGAGAFKAFMPVSDPSYPHVTDAEFLDGMREVKAVGGLVLVHARRLAPAGRHCADAGRRPRRRDGASRGPPAVRRGGGGAPRAVPRAHADVDPDRARLESRQRGARARGEARRAAGDDGDLPASPAARPRRSRASRPLRRVRARAARPRARERLWDFVLDGTADCLVSDHSASTYEEKDAGLDDVFLSPLGCQVMQETMPLVLDEAFHRRGLALDAFVRFSSANAARISGTYPRKGSLLPGADADIVLYDLESEWEVDARSQQFSKNPWSPFDGRRVRARVVRTLLRGETVYAGGEILARPGSGRFLSCHGEYALAPGTS